MPRQRWTVPLLAAVCAGALLGLAGCTQPAAAGLPDGVTVEVLQGRTDYASGTLVIRVVNGSDTNLAVAKARLESASFAKPAVWDRGTTVRAGTTVDLRAPVPDADCAGEATRPSVRLTLESRGVADAVSVHADDPLGTLERLQTAGCIAEAVDDIAEIAVGAPGVDGAGRSAVAVLPLMLAPTGADGWVEVDSVGSTPLLKPDALSESDDANTWPVSIIVDAASAPVTVPLRIVPARCDPHAIAEDKIGTVLVLAVALDDGTTGDYRLTPPEDVREALLDFVREHCGMA